MVMSIPGTHSVHVDSHLSVPIVDPDGHAFGTVCCFTHHPEESVGNQMHFEMQRTVAAPLTGTFGPQRRRAP